MNEIFGVKIWYPATNKTIPRGTVLGPVLFIIYMNDVIENIKHCKIRFCRWHYIIQRNYRDAKKLQEDLKSLQLWEGTWLLKFSIPKCHVLNITRATKHKIASDYYLHNIPLEVVDSCKYLGVTIQHDLRWSEQLCTSGKCDLLYCRYNSLRFPISFWCQKLAIVSHTLF